MTSLKDQIDFDKYDSNNDGYLDVVCFNYAGPMGAWGTTWWPYVDSADITVENKKIEKYAFLKESAGTMKHEFGHIFGAPDYYSYGDTHEASIATFDMMCNSSSDHNGFTKWLFGWLSNDDISYVSEATGDTTVSLAPFETSLGDGKKIAVVAPAIDEQTPLLSEYFIVEYDTGTANNKQTFENYSYSPGFRIFHVNAKAGYDDTELYTEMTADYKSIKSYYFAIYDSSGSFLAKEVLSDSAAENMKNIYTNSIVGTDNGYYLTLWLWQEGCAVCLRRTPSAMR